jgi:hypothetical protein
MADADRVIARCEAEWDLHKPDCSGLVKAVAQRLEIKLTGLADDIVAQISTSPWSSIEDGIAACKAAEGGKLVVAGLKGADQSKPSSHGHVAVVVKGNPLAHDRYPFAYWERLGGVGKKNETLNWAWNEADRDRIVYGSIPLP